MDKCREEFERVCWEAPQNQLWSVWKTAWELGAKEEREACAKVCDAEIPPHEWYEGQRACGSTARGCAENIRMRSNA